MVQVRVWATKTASAKKPDPLVFDKNTQISAILKAASESIDAENAQKIAYEIELRFGGRRCGATGTLSEVDGVGDNATLFVFWKPQCERPDSSSSSQAAVPAPTDQEIRHTTHQFKKAMRSRMYNELLGKIINSEDTLNSLTAAIPGLAADMEVMQISADINLMIHTATSENVTPYMRKHPCFYHVLVQLLQRLRDEIGKMDPVTRMMFREVDHDEPRGQQQPRAGGGAFTQNQLAAALMNAGGAAAAGVPRRHVPGVAPPSPAQQRAAPLPNPAAAAGGFLTTEMLQAAMQQALGAATASNQPQLQPTAAVAPTQPAAAAQPPADYSSQLEQLAAMGFVNEAENTRALQTANGDLDAALEIIITERENMNLD